MAIKKKPMRAKPLPRTNDDIDISRGDLLLAQTRRWYPAARRDRCGMDGEQPLAPGQKLRR